ATVAALLLGVAGTTLALLQARAETRRANETAQREADEAERANEALGRLAEAERKRRGGGAPRDARAGPPGPPRAPARAGGGARWGTPVGGSPGGPKARWSCGWGPWPATRPCTTSRRTARSWPSWSPAGTSAVTGGWSGSTRGWPGSSAPTRRPTRSRPSAR